MAKLTDAELRSCARAFNACKGHISNAATHLGIPTSTFQMRLRRTREHPTISKLLKDFPRAVGGTKRLSTAAMDEAWGAYERHGYNVTAAAEAMGMPRATLQARLKATALARGLDMRPEATTIEQDTQRHRDRETEKASAAKLKDAIRQLSILQDRLRDLEWADNVALKPAEWTFVPRVNRKREHMPELFTSDHQVGEVVRENETEAGYGYSPEIYSLRYRRMIDTVDYLAHHHGGSGWTYPGIIYLRGGDTIDGSIHPEDSGEQTLTPLQCVELVFEEESAGIEKLAKSFGRVEVKTPGAAGNHDRTNKKPVSKKAFAHNYDRLIHKMLVNHFRRDKRVTFQTSESFDIRYKIYDQNILLTHGDRMSAGGGTGFIGPIANILKGWQKVTTEQAALGYTVNQVRSGHFHTPFWTPYGWGNGCMPGYSEFAKTFRMRPTPPLQLFGFHHRKRGLVDMKPLVLVD